MIQKFMPQMTPIDSTKILYIDSTEALQAFICQIENEPFVAVDTEFMRRKTYWPILCLIQLATKENCALIDPLAPGIELGSFFELMVNPNIVKVFHSARQDLEILYHKNNIVPHPLFDTQIAALALGLKESIAYDSLVEHFLHKKIDKSARETNWEQRPLTAEQQSYALADVTYLSQLYTIMTKQLNAKDRLSWLEEEFAILADTSLYQPNPNEAYKKIKHNLRKPRDILRLQKIAAWREEKALAKNIPRSYVLKDSTLINIAMSAPKTEKQLSTVKELSPKISNASKKALLDILAFCETVPLEQAPNPPAQRHLTHRQQQSFEVLKFLLHIIAQQLQINPRILASKEDLESLVKLGKSAPIIQQQGWRHQVFAAQALSFLDGEMVLGFEKKQIKLLPRASLNVTALPE